MGIFWEVPVRSNGGDSSGMGLWKSFKTMLSAPVAATLLLHFTVTTIVRLLVFNATTELGRGGNWIRAS